MCNRERREVYFTIKIIELQFYCLFVFYFVLIKSYFSTEYVLGVTLRGENSKEHECTEEIIQQEPTNKKCISGHIKW